MRVAVSQIVREIDALRGQNGSYPATVVVNDSNGGVPTIFVADELAMVRSGLIALIRDLGCASCGQAQSARDAIDALHLVPELIIVGVMADADVADVVARLKMPYPAPLVLVLVAAAARHGLADLLAAGVDGVVRRSGSEDEIRAAISAVLRGERYVAPTLLSELSGEVEPVIDLREGTGTATALSAREREMLVFLSQGRTNREIAESLCLSIATVKSHLIRVYAKLGVNSRSEALGVAVARGLLA